MNVVVVPKSQRPELLMSFSPVPELPGVPYKLQLDTPGELGFWGMKIVFMKTRFLSSLWCLCYMQQQAKRFMQESFHMRSWLTFMLGKHGNRYSEVPNDR